MTARLRPAAAGAALLGGLLLGLAPAARAAECTTPAVPDAAGRPAKPVLPVKGPCVDADPGANGCKGWERYTFNDEVKSYNAKLPGFQKDAEAYVARLNAFVAASAAYARCEVDRLR